MQPNPGYIHVIIHTPLVGGMRNDFKANCTRGLPGTGEGKCFLEAPSAKLKETRLAATPPRTRLVGPRLGYTRIATGAPGAEHKRTEACRCACRLRPEGPAAEHPWLA